MTTLFLQMILVSFAPRALAAASQTEARSLLIYPRGQVEALCDWREGPQIFNASTLEVRLFDATTHHPVDVASLKVDLSMPEHQDMMNPPTQPVRRRDWLSHPYVGQFEIPDIGFSMGGDWEVLVTLVYANGTEEAQALKVHLDGHGVCHTPSR